MALILEREAEKKKAKEEEARKAYIRKVNALKGEIAALGYIKSQYVNFRSSISTLINNLNDLSKNLAKSSEFLAQGMALGNVGADNGEMQETSIQASNYATKLANNFQIIDNKISSIDSMLSAKQAELSRLIG